MRMILYTPQSDTNVRLFVRWIIACFFLFSVADMYAQTPDELLKQADGYRTSSNYTMESQVLTKHAFLCWENNQLTEAVKSFNRIIEINTVAANNNGVLIALTNLGAVYNDLTDYAAAVETFRRAVQLAKKMNRKYDEINNLCNVASSLMELQKYADAIETANQALPVAKEQNDIKLLHICYRILSEAYQKSGNYDKSSEYLELYQATDYKIKSDKMKQIQSESKEEVDKAIAEKQAKEKELIRTVDTLKEVKQYASMQEMQIDLLNQQKEIDTLKKKELESELLHKRRSLFMVSVALILFLALSVVILFQFIQKKRANKLLAEQNHKITTQNQLIKDSIHYAQNIQHAILPLTENINKYYDSFIISLPKDIVSGDFYWFVHNIDLNTSVIAAVDCTGHGVPGAFMSMIGNTLLNSIINEQKFLQPSLILKKLNEDVILALKQDKTENNDGMDVCLCSITKGENNEYTVVFAGAKRPVYYMQKGKDFNQLKGDTISIGGKRKSSMDIVFHDHTLLLHSGDVLYLSSDGFTDQNSPERDRFGSSRLADIITRNAHVSMQEQKTLLTAALKDHMQNETQRDDITLIGIKLI